MTLDIVQSMWLLILGVLAILILLRILFIVHRQTRKFKELENRMKAMEQTDAATLAGTQDTKEV